MSTHSSIAIKANDKVRVIYCHFDGYIDHNGVILFKHYNTQEKVKALIELGSLSCLGESIECPNGHSFDNKISGYCVFYGRDRKEKNVSYREYNSYKEAMKYEKHEYNYFWDKDMWFVNGKYLSVYMKQKMQVKVTEGFTRELATVLSKNVVVISNEIRMDVYIHGKIAIHYIYTVEGINKVMFTTWALKKHHRRTMNLFFNKYKSHNWSKDMGKEYRKLIEGEER